MSSDDQTKRGIRVLWFHPAGTVGGASISLTELLKPLVTNVKISGTIVTPAGSAANRFAELGLEVLTAPGLSQCDNTRFGRYTGLRWLILLRELFFLPSSLRMLLALRKRRAEFDLIHLNEITLLPLGVLAKRLLRLPLVVHIRSLQPSTKDIRTRMIDRLLMHNADAVIAIDESVRRTLPVELSVQVIHNVLQVDSTTKLVEVDDTQTFRVAMVGGLLKLKGVYEFVEAARICKQRGLPAKFVIAGENVRELCGLKGWLLAKFGFSRDVRTDLERMIRDYALEEMVELKGFVRCVTDLYRSVDLLCFPSHLNAAGRPVFEAAFFGVPSVVAVEDPPADSLIHGVSGLAIPARDPAALADAITSLCLDRSCCRRMGEAARRLAEENYSPTVNAERLYAAYKKTSGHG